MRKRTYLVLFVLVFAASTLSIATVRVHAQNGAIEAEILPSEGAGGTDILIRFNTRNASIGNVETADFFWDNVTIELNKPGIQGADGSYNYWIRVPSGSSLSDLGNHTIRVDTLVLNYGQVSFNFTFEIIEYVPSPEFIALNATYYDLLTNYTDLLSLYDSLMVNQSSLISDHSTLLGEHAALLSNYNSMSANYNSLLANFNSLTANYNSLQANYNNLHSLYSLFFANYTNLLGSYQSLSSSYNALKADFDSQESNYRGLKTGNDALIGELTIARNATYIFAASTIASVATTVYLMLRKPKPASRTR